MAVGQLSTIIQHFRSVLMREDAEGMTDADLLKLYVRQRDEAAFETLVRRHGPMVLGVCRRVLHNSHDAEDAFQATFLVLVRKATTIRSVGNWLYGVAHRTALEAKKTAAKRRVKETKVAQTTEKLPDALADLLPVLDQELARLPDKYREVLVLCDLEGKSRKEAARHLGLAEGTVASRLARARVMLARRLALRGLALSGGSLAMVLSQNAASACVPASLIGSTVKAASLFAAGQAAVAGVISTKVAALTEGVLKTMLLTKIKIATAVLLVTGVFLTGIGAVSHLAIAGQTERPTNDTPAPASATREQKEPDAEKGLQGTWKLVKRSETRGTNSVADFRLIITPDRVLSEHRVYSPSAPGKAKLDEVIIGVSSYKIDASKKPKAMDVVYLAGPERTITGPVKGKTAQWVYSLEGDTLTICFDPDGKSRPTEVHAEKGRWVHVFKRDLAILVDESKSVQDTGRLQGRGPIRAPKDVRGLVVDAEVTVAAVGQLRLGQEAIVIVDAVPDKRYRGKVHTIPRAQGPGEGTVTVVVEFLDEDERLAAGMTAVVQFVTVEEQKRSEEEKLKRGLAPQDKVEKPMPKPPVAKPTEEKQKKETFDEQVKKAEAEVKKLGLVDVASSGDGIDTKFPIRFEGKAGVVSVNPGSAVLVELPKPTKVMSWQTGNFLPEQIGDRDGPEFTHVLCKWTAKGKLIWVMYRKLDNTEIKSFALRNVQATEVANTLKQLFGGKTTLSLGADARTNTLIAQCRAQELEAVEAIITLLEQQAVPKKKGTLEK